ncbi:hypothetical protein NDU88_005718 [Pleurodeles waltl]|uniref:Uncharacterized protein n=1 Tax=Pleurodeles waltl TaxID=8319 RepID=A0AAV7SML6_PLEWA|nr:hypothetical protein NDU88_005718 [Pleurodeles waltl]
MQRNSGELLHSLSEEYPKGETLNSQKRRIGYQERRIGYQEREPVQVSQVGCDVAVAGDVLDEACGDVLYALQSFLEISHGSCVQGVAVVQSAAYEGLGDHPSGSGEDPFVDVLKHAEGAEAGGRDSVDLLGL